MTDNTENSNNSPTHIAYVVRKGNSKNFWDRIGVAWQHADGKGLNIQLVSLPVDGNLTVRLASEQK
ncbi:MAG: hypothetical protein U0796_02730 [Gemmatales bacterium]